MRTHTTTETGYPGPLMKETLEKAAIAVHSTQQPHDEQRIASVLEQALRCGASAAEVSISRGSGLYINVRMGEVERLEHENDQSLSLTVYLGKRKGNTSSSDLSAAACEACVQAACAIARHASEDEYAGLAPAEMMAQAIPELDVCHPWSLEPEQAIELCVACEDTALGHDPCISNSDGAALSSYVSDYMYGNSHGFIGGWPASHHLLDCTVIASRDGSMQREGWYSKACDYRHLQDTTRIGEEAGRRCLARLGARKIRTTQAPVIFEAGVAAELFAEFVLAISGSSQYRRASFLNDRLGQQVFPHWLTIRERPHLRSALGSAPFDAEGVSTREQTIVQQGVLQSYLLDAYSARRLGMRTTGNAGGTHNLYVDPGNEGLDGLLRQMHSGLLVTDTIGFGVNQLTGDYSRGVNGFWVENGEPSFPVEEITVAGNLREMFQHITAVGNDIDWRRNILSGSVLIENMTIAGD